MVHITDCIDDVFIDQYMYIYRMQMYLIFCNILRFKLLPSIYLEISWHRVTRENLWIITFCSVFIIMPVRT